MKYVIYKEKLGQLDEIGGGCRGSATTEDGLDFTNPKMEKLLTLVATNPAVNEGLSLSLRYLIC